MTALATAIGARREQRFGGLLGLRNLLRKDVREWMHGRRVVIVFIVSTLVYALAAGNAWINDWVRANLPAGEGEVPPKVLSLLPMDNILFAVGTQFFVLVAIFATISLIIGEREGGTLSWTLSKPASRTSFLVSKWLAATILLWVAAIIVPVALTTVLVTALYGLPDLGAVTLMALGLVGITSLYVAVSLTAATFIPSQGGVAAVGLAVFALPEIVGGIVPAVSPFLPTSIGPWAVSAALSGPAPVTTPIAWLVGIALLFLVARRRFAAMEL
jgi:hypothetical protein